MHLDGVAISPALLRLHFTALFYLRLDLRFGVAMTVSCLPATLPRQLIAGRHASMARLGASSAFVVG